MSNIVNLHPTIQFSPSSIEVAADGVLVHLSDRCVFIGKADIIDSRADEKDIFLTVNRRQLSRLSPSTKSTSSPYRSL